MNAPAIPITDKNEGLAFTFREVRGRSTVVIALAILLILPIRKKDNDQRRPDFVGRNTTWSASENASR